MKIVAIAKNVANFLKGIVTLTANGWLLVWNALDKLPDFIADILKFMLVVYTFLPVFIFTINIFFRALHRISSL
jgi:hypothetical protein